MITILYIVSYDIVEQKRRNRLAKYLCGFGDRVQYSVFEILNKTGMIDEIAGKSRKIINEKEDSICVYSLCSACQKKIRRFGVKKGRWYDDEFIVL